MSGTENCHDNAAVLRRGQQSIGLSPVSLPTFYATIKVDLLQQRSWRTRRAVGLAIFNTINGFYNPRRRHSALGWKSALAFEVQAAKMSNRSGLGP